MRPERFPPTDRLLLPAGETRFHAHSFVDPVGRLFWWNHELYRGINPEWTALALRLFESGLVERLVERGLLIESQLTDYSTEGCGLVIHHRTIPFLSYPNEWCPAMFKDAVLLILDLAIELSRNGLVLKDAHPWNVLFDGCRPIFVDFPSIMSENSTLDWPAYENFRRFGLLPLVLMSCGQQLVARLLLYEGEGVSEDHLAIVPKECIPPSIRLTGTSRLRSFLWRTLPHRLRQLSSGTCASLLARNSDRHTCDQSPPGSLLQLRSELARVDQPGHVRMSARRSIAGSASATRRGRRTERVNAVREAVTKLRPASVLDVGSNDGACSKAAAVLGCKVVSLDKDTRAVAQLYGQARAADLSILPLVMDFAKPTPARGPLDHWSVAAHERLQCDMVIALGEVVGRMAQDLYFEQIVEGLALFSKRWLITEFIPGSELPALLGSTSHPMGWYTLDNYVSTLKKRFGSVEVIASYPQPRTFMVCQK